MPVTGGGSFPSFGLIRRQRLPSKRTTKVLGSSLPLHTSLSPSRVCKANPWVLSFIYQFFPVASGFRWRRSRSPRALGPAARRASEDPRHQGASREWRCGLSTLAVHLMLRVSHRAEALLVSRRSFLDQVLTCRFGSKRREVIN